MRAEGGHMIGAPQRAIGRSVLATPGLVRTKWRGGSVPPFRI